MARIVIILGLLMFAAQAPKLIKDLFGVKGDGADYGLNLKSKIASSPVAAGAVGLAGGAIAGGAANAIAGASKVKTAWNDSKGAGFKGRGGALAKAIGAGTLSTVAGMTSASRTSMMTAAKSGKNFNMRDALVSGKNKAVDNRVAREKRKENFNLNTPNSSYSENIKNATGIGKIGAALSTFGTRTKAHLENAGTSTMSNISHFAGTDVSSTKAMSGNIAAWQNELAALEKIESKAFNEGKFDEQTTHPGALLEGEFTAEDGTIQKYKYREYGKDAKVSFEGGKQVDDKYQTIMKTKAELEAKIKHEQERLDKRSPKKEKNS